jgi:hypothetical protein
MRYVDVARIVVTYPPPPSVAATGIGLKTVSHTFTSGTPVVVPQTNLSLRSLVVIRIKTDPSEFILCTAVGAAGKVIKLILHV